jgi:hypothetical protein
VRFHSLTAGLVTHHSETHRRIPFHVLLDADIPFTVLLDHRWHCLFEYRLSGAPQQE